MADIISTSYLGIFWSSSDYNVYRISGDYPEYIDLKFIDFDVGCETGAIFEIFDDTIRTRYCNKNKPMYSIRSTFNTLIVKFQIKSCGSRVLVEGFRGRYNVLVKNENISNLVSYEEIGM